MKKIITVDGPAGSGKEKISRYIARKWPDDVVTTLLTATIKDYESNQHQTRLHGRQLRNGSRRH